MIIFGQRFALVWVSPKHALEKGSGGEEWGVRSEEEGSVRVGFRRGRRVGERYGGNWKGWNRERDKIGIGFGIMRWKWKHLVLNKCNLKIWCLEDSVKSLSFAHCYRDYSLVGNEAFRCVCVLLHFSAYNLWHFYTTHPSFHFSLSPSLSLPPTLSLSLCLCFRSTFSRK